MQFSILPAIKCSHILHSLLAYEQINTLVNGHPARDGAVLDVWQLGHVVHLLGIVVDPPRHNMWLQPHAKVCCAHAGVDDCQDNQDNRDCGKTRQTLSDRNIVDFVAGLVHSSHLEDKVCQSTEEQENSNDHAEFVLATSPEGCHKENKNGYGDSGNCEAEFGTC
jgi:hypothetical protein